MIEFWSPYDQTATYMPPPVYVVALRLRDGRVVPNSGLSYYQYPPGSPNEVVEVLIQIP